MKAVKKLFDWILGGSKKHVACSKKEAKILVNSTSLDIVRWKVKEKCDWDDSRLNEAEREYRKFLYLAACNPEETVVPWTEDLDIFWHYHVLDTRKYTVDCERIFGYYLHHDPTTPLRPEFHRKAEEKTKSLYSKSFRDDRGNSTKNGGSGCSTSSTFVSCATSTPISTPVVSSPVSNVCSDGHSSSSSSCSGGSSCGGGGGCGGGG